MIRFIGYVIKYKSNTMKLSRLEEEIELLKNECEFYEHKADEKNKALRQINNLIVNYEKGGPIRTKLYNDIKQVVNDNVEKKLSDEILTHYVQ